MNLLNDIQRTVQTQRELLQYKMAELSAASAQAGAKALLTEHMQDGRTIERMQLINPFAASNAAAIGALLRR